MVIPLCKVRMDDRPALPAPQAASSNPRATAEAKLGTRTRKTPTKRAIANFPSRTFVLPTMCSGISGFSRAIPACEHVAFDVPRQPASFASPHEPHSPLLQATDAQILVLDWLYLCFQSGTVMHTLPFERTSSRSSARAASSVRPTPRV